MQADDSDRAISKERWWSPGMGVAVAVAGLLMVSSLVLFVLPGYAVFIVGDMPFGRYFGHVHGDNWLPIAMQMQLLWAPMVPVAYALARRVARGVRSARGGGRITAAAVACGTFAGGVYLWAVLLATALHYFTAERT